jgi:ATP-dependent DNA ligase
MPLLYPPHPSSKIPNTSLDSYESSGEWIAQRKFNGTHVLVHVFGEKVSILNRHGTSPKMFSLSESHVEQFISLNIDTGKEYWFNGELLDHKTCSPEYKGKIVLFDILQAGRYFMRGPTQSERLDILADICGRPVGLEPGRGIALSVSEDIWLAENWAAGFKDRFSDFLDMDEIEGLVLRKSSSVLESFGQKKYDVHWILRCRKPHKSGSYNF